MSTEVKAVIVIALLIHVAIIWSCLRMSARAERAARARRREFKQSLLNRRA